ncbi:PDZ domain-containing protein 8 [Spea bombifrons]|uniref:PDZ domain-containing protein 8 n=1 Tax=Spea bombifrons TaxID=233779 RepID=UPI00234B5044|nr:PDZ domain-containing protein 8 [Spea bombifrons]
MLLVVLFSALAGCLLTVLAQYWLLSRRPPPPPVPRAVPPSPPSAGPAESCHFLNAIFLFVFRELRDTTLLRRWLRRKIQVEFEELLCSRTAGRLLEGLSLRDMSLGERLPVLRSVRPEPGSAAAGGAPDELAFELEVEYPGGLQLAVDVELVFGKSARLSVRLGRVQGRVRMLFSRLPFNHWAVCFAEEPLLELDVQSEFEGRPMPQLTSIIANQLKRVIRRKHTLPNYKIRYKPFFPSDAQPSGADLDEPSLTLQDMGLADGRLKVSLIDCSRLLIFGSYEQETHIHCTLEISGSPWKEKSRTSIKTVELVKGTSQSIGLIMVQARDGDTGHVCVETVTPNSPAAAADLKKGDRLIAIGGVKVTSSVQASKLIKQAGDRVLVFYERPAGQNQCAGGLQEGFGAAEDSGFSAASCQQNFEDDAASLIADPEIRELDSEFEDLACEMKPPGELKEEPFLPANPSPKRAAANLPAKPVGSVSPSLSRKMNVSGYQTAPKPLPKAGKTGPPESRDTDQQSRPSAMSSNRPPVPPRPQVKLTLTTCETSSAVEAAEPAVDKPERPPPPALNGEKQSGKHFEPTEDVGPQKPSSLKQDAGKDKLPESSTGTKDGVDDQNAWESPEVLYRNRQGRWTRSSRVFEVESHHKYLNVALWCRDSFKTGSLCCVGHVSIRLEDIALECLATSSLEHVTRFRLNAPEPKAAVTRTALRTLSMHKGFNEKFCYGDVTLNFRYLMDGESENASVLLEKERDLSFTEDTAALQKDEALAAPVVFAEAKHNFQDTQFQNSTLCDHCKRKVWTKAASQCMICGYVCHKKCQDKCLAENPYCVALEKRADLESKSLGNRTTGITRHIINTSSRLLNLRQTPKARPQEQGSDPVEPSPKHTPNTSDNESSDTETGGASSPSKRASGGSAKLVRKEGGLDDSVFIAVKEIGRDLYRGLPTDERIQKLEFMLDKLQNEIDQELEHNNSLVREEKDVSDPRRKALLTAALLKSGERLQALTLLMIHYRAGIEDIESLENSSLAQPRKTPKYDEESVTASDADTGPDGDPVHEEPEPFGLTMEEKLPDSPEAD